MRMLGRNSLTIASRSGLRDFRVDAFRILSLETAACPCAMAFALVCWGLNESCRPIGEQTVCHRVKAYKYLICKAYLFQEITNARAGRQYSAETVNYLTVSGPRTDRTLRASVSRSYGFWRNSSNPSGTAPESALSASEVPEQRIA